MNCFQHIPESRGAIAQPPRGGATKKKADPTTQHALIGFKHPHLPQPSALHNRTCPCPLTSDRTRNARAPTSPRSIGFCAIWDCISSSSTWRRTRRRTRRRTCRGMRRRAGAKTTRSAALWRAGFFGARRRARAVLGACRRGQRRWGVRFAVRRRGDVFLGVCRRGRGRGGLQPYQLRAAWGATGQLSGIWLGLWESASGTRTRTRTRTNTTPYGTEANAAG